MPIKREISISVSDLQLNSVSDSIKRLAISKDGHPDMALSIRNPDSLPMPITTVLSNARDGFQTKYEFIREIGKGGFSIVYQCKNKQTGVDYAVKVVDLRPLRLRERFNPTRLKREVDIMRRLKHPNIVQFIEVFEDVDHLMMVMEFCPGKELFDVILSRKHLHEDEARPIFAQVSRALYYLHSLNIIHRDIKPENVLILDNPDSKTGQDVAKLLDFGLSKNAAAGSAAKTFVGTPCYLAPEVEMTSRGLGGTYGLPADCWSLGAVLYVMLVARFPEFEQERSTGKVVVKLPPQLWQNISTEAKQLIRGLMDTDPNTRYDMKTVLLHPWLGTYRATVDELKYIHETNSTLGQKLQQEYKQVVQLPPEITPAGAYIQNQDMIVRQTEEVIPTNYSSSTFEEDQQLPIAPLLNLQRNIANCFSEAHKHYAEMPEVAAQIRKGATLCRQQLIESTTMLRKVEQTSKEVLELFPDLELAIEESEPKLAADFFNVVKGWVGELKETVTSIQLLNKESMGQIQKIVEQSAISVKEYEKKKQSIVMSKKLLDNIIVSLRGHDESNNNNAKLLQNGQSSSTTTSPSQQLLDDNITLDANQVMQLFVTLFSAQTNFSNNNNNNNNNNSNNTTTTTALDSPSKRSNPNLANYFSPMNTEKMDNNSFLQQTPENMNNNMNNINNNINNNNLNQGYHMNDIDIDPPSTYQHLPPTPSPNKTSTYSAYNSPAESIPSLPSSAAKNAIVVPRSSLAIEAPSPRVARLADALNQLHQVDLILEQLAVFWANTEVILDLLTKKGQHIEQFIGFSTKPRLMERFRERMNEYKRFWDGVRMMCNNYVSGVQETQDCQKSYSFLDKTDRTSQSQSQSQSMSSDVPLGYAGEISSIGSNKGDSFDSINNSFFGEQQGNGQGMDLADHDTFHHQNPRRTSGSSVSSFNPHSRF